MPADAIAHDPMAYRYFDYPRPGSIYRLPDIPQLVRGPTYVKMPSGRDVEVPAQLKSQHPTPASVHEDGKAKDSLQELLKQLTGQRRDRPTPGFKPGGAFDRNTQNPQLHVREAPRRAAMGDHVFQF